MVVPSPRSATINPESRGARQKVASTQSLELDARQWVASMPCPIHQAAK
jgi:hypothetical protein